jgi:hypothetical protein
VTMDRGELLRLLRDDPEVQGAILALLAGALVPEQPHQPQQPATRRKPDWVLRQLEASDAAHAAARGDA